MKIMPLNSNFCNQFATKTNEKIWTYAKSFHVFSRLQYKTVVKIFQFPSNSDSCLRESKLIIKRVFQIHAKNAKKKIVKLKTRRLNSSNEIRRRDWARDNTISVRMTEALLTILNFYIFSAFKSSAIIWNTNYSSINYSNTEKGKMKKYKCYC